MLILSMATSYFYFLLFSFFFLLVARTMTDNVACTGIMLNVTAINGEKVLRSFH